MDRANIPVLTKKNKKTKMKYQKQTSISGKWAKGSELTGVSVAKIVSETKPIPSSFQDKKGNPKTQDVAKVVFGSDSEPLNVSLNRATINGLIDAFGDDSTAWMNKSLKVETEKVRVAGKAVTALYLIPEGYKKIDDESGFAVIVKESYSQERHEKATNSAELDVEMPPATDEDF